MEEVFQCDKVWLQWHCRISFFFRNGISSRRLDAPWGNRMEAQQDFPPPPNPEIKGKTSQSLMKNCLQELLFFFLLDLAAQMAPPPPSVFTAGVDLRPFLSKKETASFKVSPFYLLWRDDMTCGGQMMMRRTADGCRFLPSNFRHWRPVLWHSSNVLVRSSEKESCRPAD